MDDQPCQEDTGQTQEILVLGLRPESCKKVAAMRGVRLQE